MPSKIEFKDLGEVVNLKMELVQYPSDFSKSGAYIFAPYIDEMLIQLKIADAYFIDNEGKGDDKFVVVYKSLWNLDIQASIAVSISHA